MSRGDNAAYNRCDNDKQRNDACYDEPQLLSRCFPLSLFYLRLAFGVAANAVQPKVDNLQTVVAKDLQPLSDLRVCRDLQTGRRIDSLNNLPPRGAATGHAVHNHSRRRRLHFKMEVPYCICVVESELTPMKGSSMDKMAVDAVAWQISPEPG